MSDASPRRALSIRPGPWFWLNHLWLGFFALCVAQVIAVDFGGTAQVVAAAGVVAVFAYSGARTEVRIDDSEVLIRNPCYTRRIPVSDISRVTPQKVRIVRAGSTNCVAFWAQGAREGWPAIATLRFSDGATFDPWSAVAEGVRRHLGDGVDSSQVNPSWSPGAFKRRTGSLQGSTYQGSEVDDPRTPDGGRGRCREASPAERRMVEGARMKRIISIVVPVVLLSGCQPMAESLTVTNPCDTDLVVQVWDRPEPGEDDADAVKATAKAEAATPVQDAVTDLGEGSWSVVVLRRDAPPVIVNVPITPTPVAVIPASACAG